ncbi:monovalent cation/proton antiporter, MnhG/PhaG subunit [Geoglobus ahangari]|uniref:Monovalent cation/proton antiporter, MnhG/PhaG subunit n=1 Tax=Geoglobus ahangari TaxID=113653 RepID=A0A0F7IDE8_9EURY|nr:monovalent cation/H(+) antiporter subunit G [Geoglobus ahangari]AKG91433.1 monovalent cation/proton antiporter, MnhG/PhaG subunit [Geoglobus ahangari]NOY10590.1 monovalent cation/H(+) antiporter subunit G [Archaeoglobi archaeon]
MEALHVVSALLMFSGVFFMIAGALGIIRFPDFYTRLHAAGKCDTLGEVLIILGFMVYEGFSFLSVKLLFLSFFILLANPVGTHALIKAAYLTGVKMWKKEESR